MVGRVLAWAGWLLLGLLATAGVTISGAALFAASDVGRPVVARVLVKLADDAVAGRLELAGIEVTPTGDVDVRGLRAFDPDGHLVLAVDRAKVSADLRRLRSRVLGLSAELQGPSVLVEEQEGGGTSLARAFAPARPDPRAPAEREREAGAPGSPWTVRVTGLTVRGGDVWWVDARGETRLEASGLDLDARAVLAPDRDRLQLRLSGALGLPFSGQLELAVRATRDGDAVRLPVLRGRAGDTVVEGLGEWDLATGRGRAALTRLALARSTARVVVPDLPPGGDVAVSGYAESDGVTATAAIHLAPPAGETAGGGDAAVAARVDGRALGLEVDLEALDPARLHAAAPSGQVTLRARGGAAGASLATARGKLTFALARSRVRGGVVGPAEGDVAFDAGSWDVRRLQARAPGLAVDGAGRWRAGGAVSGSFAVDGADLAAAGRNLGLLLDAELPPLSGRARANVQLSGTEAAPRLEGRVEAPAAGVGGVAVTGATAGVSFAGPLRAPAARVDAEVRSLRSGGAERARALELRGTLEADVFGLTASALVPGLGRDPVTLRAAGRREGDDGERLRIEELTLAYPETRFALTRPATLELDGPRVDALELAAGAQRLRVEGGLGPRGRLDARATVAALRLDGLPAGILPEEERIRGVVTGEATLRGTERRPEVVARVELADGAFRRLAALDARAEVTWLGDARRLLLDVSARRGAGGAVSARGELPLPLRGRGPAPLTLEVEGEGLPLDALLDELELAAEGAPRLAGTVALDARLGGVVSAPELQARLAVEGGVAADVEGLGLVVTLAAPAREGAPQGRAGRGLRATVEASLQGRPAFNARVWSALEAAALLGDPAAAAKAFPETPLEGDLISSGLVLEDLAGRAGLPEELGGRLAATVKASGTPARPRGRAALRLVDAAYAGYRPLTAALDVDAGAERVAATLEVGLGGEVVARGKGSLAAPLERLATRAGLRAAPLRAEVELPASSTALARAAGPDVPVAGTLAGRLGASGTLAAVVADAELHGTGLSVEGRPLGTLDATFRTAAAGTSVAARLRPTSGGAVDAELRVDAGLGIDREVATLRAAPATARLTAEALDLGFLAAALPGTVRTASGRLEARLEAKGPLEKLSPRGELHLEGGRVAVSEYGDWSDIAIDVKVTDDGFELPRLEARRGAGRVSATGALRGVSSGAGKLTGKIDTERLAISRAGMDLATLDLALRASGTWTPSALDVRLDLPEGTVRLPKKTPRELQSLERRRDIVVGRAPRERARPGAAEGTGSAGRPRSASTAAARPFTTKVRAVAPGRLMVLSDNPRVNLELKADVTYELVGDEDYASGSVEVVRGWVEPIGGRNFQVKRGKVTFTGGPPRSALLDVEAVWEHPAALVTVNVTGPAAEPEFRLTSQPPMDDAQIALLVATGRTELKAGTGGASSITGEEAGRAAAGALATQLFKDVVADRLPFDVALDASTVRAGRYFTDRVYVGYVRRLDAQVNEGENLDEVRVEYEITPRWNFEWRYGNAQSGAASLIWSKEY